ncbi:protein kinase domain-containing protein [Catenulispora pinisilvae]|uniref:protein kinase domain-containing protein n=1 Tax=Catenulispora pinisilvae TaxID=2705253 RepID=UPI0018920054|nr:PQQ-binding-like beta-propeller repeat protein [Catenulispora pinisilvae]
MDQLKAGDPERVGPYTLLGRLGAGGMGAVYLGRSAAGRTVAVKVVIAELAREEGFRARFRAEVAAARSVRGAFTAPVVDADPDADPPWMATAFVPGVPLSAAVAAYGPLPERTLSALAAGIAEALLSVHAAGLVHRDLKPGNVLLAADGPHVIDFGIARAVEGAAAFTAPGAVVGSPAFMSPEQASGRQITPAGDVFSLGGTLVYAATGRAPFGSGPTPEQLERVANGTPDLSGVPAALLEMVGACLAKDPAARATPRQIIDFVERTAPPSEGGAWLPAAVSAAVDAAGAVITAGVGGDPDVAAAGMPASPVWPSEPVPPGSSVPSVPSGPVSPYPPTAATPLPMGPNAPTVALPTGPGAVAPVDPGRRKVLIALAGGAVVVAAGGGVAGALSGGKSTRTGPVALPTPARSATASGPAPTPGGASTSGTSVTGGASATPSDTAFESPSLPAETTPSTVPGVTKPWVPPGPLPAPAGKPGVLDGPAAQPLWTQPISDSSDAVGTMASANGLVIVAREGTSGIGAVDRAGKTVWQNKDLIGSVGSGLGATADGLVFLAVGGNGESIGDISNVAAVDAATGGTKWNVPMPGQNWMNPSVRGVLGPAVFVVGSADMGTDSDFVWALDRATGKTLWTKTGPEYKNLLIPSIGTQVLVVGGVADNPDYTVYTLALKDGSQVWQHHSENGTDYAVDGPERVCYAADRYVFMQNSTTPSFFGAYPTSGELAWEVHLPDSAGAPDTLLAVITGPGGDLVLGLGQRGLYAADAKTQKMVWAMTLPEDSSDSFDNFGAVPLQTADGQAYAMTSNGTLYAVDIATGRLRWKYNDPSFSNGLQACWIAVPGGVLTGTNTMLTALPVAGT